ncbi:hypothetical protein AVEN_45191-1 [Araneus ventricosus]|uniref:Uncharacterized protein n=1 Tax=Araneus ventricosus TaxID=182803 RepID=A0A4Y2V3Z1_ARAVE|nr:hypothetical protein AVEN_45191-1 [Araneus ventricosus]
MHAGLVHANKSRVKCLPAGAAVPELITRTTLTMPIVPWWIHRLLEDAVMVALEMTKPEDYTHGGHLLTTPMYCFSEDIP